MQPWVMLNLNVPGTEYRDVFRGLRRSKTAPLMAADLGMRCARRLNDTMIYDGGVSLRVLCSETT